MNVQQALTQCGMTAEHFESVGRAVSEGYMALKRLSEGSTMLSQFLPGHRSLGYLRNVAVQYALHLRAAGSTLYESENAWNAVNNHAFLNLKYKNVVLTAHYCGPKGTRGIRKAIFRSELQCRNGDLFGYESVLPDANLITGTAYAQIVHGGLDHPVLAAIRIPNRDQLSYKLRPLVLELHSPSAVKVEEVQDRIADAISKRKKSDKRERDVS